MKTEGGNQAGSNGAQYLCDALLANNIDVCFANPGTSEMHFVAALDQRPQMRCVLGLFEGVVTGAADGYARMAGKPAATLLHLGSGLGNGLANLHNARRARSPVINVVGDHASYHLKYDAPLTSDIHAIASSVSDYVTTASVESLAESVSACVSAATRSPGGVSTLILPANVAWSGYEGGQPQAVSRAQPERPDVGRVKAAAQALRSGEPAALFLGSLALKGKALLYAHTIAQCTGARLMAETSNARVTRGNGRPTVVKLPYPVDDAIRALAGLSKLVLVGSAPPVAFFAYPGKPSELKPEGCEEVSLATPYEDIEGALEALLSELGIDKLVQPESGSLPTFDIPAHEALTPDTLGRALAALLPEEAILVDEGITQGRAFYGHSHFSAPHDYLQLTGGAIGSGLPLATGAAVACPTRQVVSLQGDGSGMYTVQSLWTQAREKLKCLTIILANCKYAILQGEMRNVGVSDWGPNAHQMLELDKPDLDWISIAHGMGVPGGRAANIGEFTELFRQGLQADGPFLIEAVIGRSL